MKLYRLNNVWRRFLEEGFLLLTFLLLIFILQLLLILLLSLELVGQTQVCLATAAKTWWPMCACFLGGFQLCNVCNPFGCRSNKQVCRCVGEHHA